MKEREYSGCEIAIIGMSGRFPGANSIEAYWQNLKNGIPAIRFLDDEELLSRGVDRRSLQKPGYVKVCSMLDDIELFDASFFGYTPREAALMDPQHRIFLECAWEALESAGYSPEKTAEIISVFASATTNTYLLYNLLSNPELLNQLDPVQIDVSNGNDYLATRVSYKLNLTGPSCTVQSACSSSLVAVHMACQNLLNQESDIAIAGGISIDVRQQYGYQYSDGSIVSPDGYCRAFDAEANGTVFGSGVGVVVLRRLEDALAKGDTIFAIIKGSAMNNDGADKVGYTAPGVDGQAAVIAEALSVAGCGAETISYVETHGTGTKMGDPVEIRALSKAFKAQTTTEKNYCAIGSVKTQIGHLAGAAGISSLIKTVLALHYRQIPASLNFKAPNPEIDFLSTPFFVNTELKEWEHPLRRAGVSSFGVGGTNVHLVLEEAPEVKVTDSVRNCHLLLLSAKTENALTLTREALVESLRQNSGLNPADVTFTLQTGRKDFNYRLFAVFSDLKEAVAILQSGDNSKIVSSFTDLENRPVVFVFPGEDNQEDYIPCGLYEHEPLFKEKYDKCLDILNELLSKTGQPNVRITRQSIYELEGSPILKKIDHFITEYSLAAFLITIGIIPEAMIGEGVGEYTTACVAGVLSVEQVFLLYLGQDLSAENNISEQAHFDFQNAIRELQRNAPKIPFISAISGHWISDSEALSADYWLAVRKTTSQFTSGLLKITDDETEKIFLQIGRSSLNSDAMTGLKNALIYRTNNDYQGNESDVSSFFHVLGELWLKGVKIDWQGLYINETRRRIPLPTYPFKRERYWIERIQQGALEEDARPSIEKNIIKENDPDNWFYFPGWKSSNLPNKDYVFEQEEKWLVFCDQSPFSSELDRYLKANKQRVILVYAGGSFQTLAKDCYSIHPGQQRDYQALFTTLKDQDVVPSKILHLWSLNNDPDFGKDSLTDTTTFDAFQEKGFWSVIYTAVALEKPSLPDFSYQMWIITDHLLEVENNDIICPEKATLLSPVRVIPIEYPYIDCYCLDLKQTNISSSGVVENVSRIFKEIQTAGSDKIIAFRGKRRWLPNYEQIQLKELHKPLRREGVYLVTDDSNGIGLLIAEYLVKTCQAKVILIENKSFPQRGSWSLWSNKEEIVGNKIQKIIDLEETGRLQWDCMDLSEYEPVEQLIKQVIESYGALHGVIHGADDFNHTGFYPIQEIDYGKPADYFNLKINSVYHLKKALAPYQLDFLMLISSLAPLLGGLGQIINAAQCSFLDSFAAREGAYWLSVSWDIWQLTGKNRRLQEGIYKDAIEPEEGIRAFQKIITAFTGSRLIVSTTNLQMRILQLGNVHLNINETEKKSANVKHPRPELKTLFIAPGSETEKKLAAIWENCLGIDKIGIDDSFFDLGGDSLISINVMNEISSAFGRKIPAAILYQKATIRDLSQLLGEEDASAKQMRSEILSKRKEALSRRNQLLNKKHQLKFSEGEGNDE
ncbi:MAG: KR domain-containing protein [Firmicutes bacterium]|nr:KR domain-containing protein [Bacillota bacterium]